MRGGIKDRGIKDSAGGDRKREFLFFSSVGSRLSRSLLQYCRAGASRSGGRREALEGDRRNHDTKGHPGKEPGAVFATGEMECAKALG